MATIKIPKKAQDRLVAGLKRYQPIVGKLRERDISEADTVTVIKDMLSSDSLADYHRQAQILNRYTIAELLQGDAMVATLRRELRRLFDGLKVTEEELKAILTNDVIKRDTLDGEPFSTFCTSPPGRTCQGGARLSRIERKKRAASRRPFFVSNRLKVPLSDEWV